MGCDGIKMIEGKTSERKAIGVPLDDPAYDGLYGYLAADGIPLLLHVGDPATFWDPDHATDHLKERGWYYGDGTFPALEELRAEAANILERFPGLQVLFAHFFFMSEELDRLAELLDRHPSVRVDVTPGGEMYHGFARDRAAAREFFTRYADRILFGTDNAGGRRTPNPERTAAALAKVTGMRTFFETANAVTCFGGELQGLQLDREVLDRLYAGNFLGWAGAEPKPVNSPMAVSECDRLADLARGVAGCEEVVETLDAVRQQFLRLGEGDL
jgi:hypothetical protein